MAGEWQEVTFSEAVVVNPRVDLTKGEDYPFVEMAAVEPNARSVRAGEHRPFRGGGARFAVGDTLMARITPSLEHGKISRFVDDDGAVAHGSTEFIVIRGRPGVTDSGFAYYLTRWEGVSDYAVGHMTGTSGRQRVPTDALDHLSIGVPPLAEQRAIAHVLGTLDDKIELNRRMNETLEAIARALFKSWFVDFDPVRAKAEGRDPGLPPAIAELFPDRFEPSELGEIPAGWRVKAIDEIARFENGLALQNRPPTGGGSLPVIKIAQLRSGSTGKADRCSRDLPEEYVVDDGDVLFSWSGSLECVLWAGGEGGLNQHLFKVTSELVPKWFYYLSVHQHLPEFRQIAAGKATTMGHIQRYHLSDAFVTIADEPVMAAANAVLSPLIDCVVLAGIEGRSVGACRDALLPKLVSGAVRVTDAERFAEAAS